ncbi:MAG TPA: hypothetical protein VMW15_13320 [Terracidiphilus sp.]|nr:hypothetical protein [Terracidiphilus sp.]
MPNPTRSWQLIVSVLLIVLVLAITMGMVWHHYDQCSAGNCTLCHMVIAPPAAVIGAIGLVPVTAEYAVLENGFVSRCRVNEKPPRAPPV